MRNILEILNLFSGGNGWGNSLLFGLLHTIEIALGAYSLGLLIGMFGAYGKLYVGGAVGKFFSLYTTLVRAVPELILILLLYYAGTDLLNQFLIWMGYGRADINGLAAGIIVLGLVQGAYSTEVLRGAIQAVPQGQIEAGRAYGMPTLLLLRRITVPAMLPHALPGLGNLWLAATKDTALLAVVGFSELALATRQAAGVTKAYFTFFLAAGALYYGISLLSILAIWRIERWASRGRSDQKARAQ